MRLPMPLKVCLLFFVILALLLLDLLSPMFRWTSDVFFLCFTAALVTAHAHISALEAELKASREGWESANAAKVFAEKSAKSAENKAKKAEKALAEFQRRQAERAQSIAERLDKISVLVGSKYHIAPLEYLIMLSFADVCLLICLCLCGTVEKIGEYWKLHRPNTKDLLLAAVDLLESNWKLVQNVL
jgi:hypothetical protein